MSDSFKNRTGYDAPLEDAIQRVADAYNLGQIKSTKLIEVGMEDYNLHAITDKGEYIVKIVTKLRSTKSALRYLDIMKIAIKAGINHPELYKDKDGKDLHIDNETGLRFIVIEFIKGKTFYDMKRSPNDEELAKILEQAVKIHNMDYSPEVEFDSWAIPNIQWLYGKTLDFLDAETKSLVDRAIEAYNKIPVDKLPKCFMHGDLVPTNIIKGEDDKIYIIDFAVANVYPRIQELAVVIADLLEESKLKIKDRIEKVSQLYLQCGGELTPVESDSLLPYSMAAMAIEIMGGHFEKYVNKGDNLEEIDWYINMGKSGLKEALSLFE